MGGASALGWWCGAAASASPREWVGRPHGVVMGEAAAETSIFGKQGEELTRSWARKICLRADLSRRSIAAGKSRWEHERAREPSELLTRPPSPIVLHYATRDLVVLYPNATGVSAIVCGVLSGPRSRSQSHVPRL